MYKQIESLVFLSKRGDEKAKEKLLFKLKPLILSSIRKYYNDYSQYDDLIQEGYEIILNCLKHYDSSKGAKFLGYVKIQLKYHYLDKQNEKRYLSLNASIGEEGEEYINFLEDDGLGPLALILNKELRELLYEGFLILTKRQREIFSFYYIKNMSMVEISKLLSLSYRTVVNTKTRALKKLRYFINKNVC